MTEHQQDPHAAENNPEASTADVLYAALVRILWDIEHGYEPGIGAQGQAHRAIRRYQSEAQNQESSQS